MLYQSTIFLLITYPFLTVRFRQMRYLCSMDASSYSRARSGSVTPVVRPRIGRITTLLDEAGLSVPQRVPPLTTPSYFDLMPPTRATLTRHVHCLSSNGKAGLDTSSPTSRNGISLGRRRLKMQSAIQPVGHSPSMKLQRHLKASCHERLSQLQALLKLCCLTHPSGLWMSYGVI